MAKKILLVRHGQALEKDQGQLDKDRTLSTQGLQNSSLMGNYLSKQKIMPDLIISSDAARAVQTSRLIAEQIDYSPDKIHLNKEVYDGTVRSLLVLINKISAKYDTVMIVGHNPTMLYLSEYLTNAEIGAVTTCGIVCIEFKSKSWNEITENSGTLIEYIYPESVNEMGS